ncbi:hypothetical protein ABZ907_43820 [Nonomuraea wenchangensis]
MRTIDQDGIIRVWEFKISATYDGLGQVLTYTALARLDVKFQRPVRGVLAAFEVQPEVVTAIEVLNLGIEVIVLPDKLRLAGGVPLTTPTIVVPQIPNLSILLPSTRKDEP